jgi:hypothetical protein
MSDLGNPELGSEATYFYETHMRAERAFSQRNWILAATLCRALAELELEAATITGAALAWNGDTSNLAVVPLLKEPHGAGRTPDGLFSFDRREQACQNCGLRGKPYTEIMAAGTFSDPGSTVDGETRWMHSDELGYPQKRDHPFMLGE